MKIESSLPARLDIQPPHAPQPFLIDELGALTIAGYVDVSRSYRSDYIVPQPLLLYKGRPATRPFRFETASDHTFFTLNKAASPDSYAAEETAHVVIATVSRVFIPDDKRRLPFVQVTGRDTATYFGVDYYGDTCLTAEFFDRPLPYDPEVFAAKVDEFESLS